MNLKEKIKSRRNEREEKITEVIEDKRREDKRRQEKTREDKRREEKRREEKRREEKRREEKRGTEVETELGKYGRSFEGRVRGTRRNVYLKGEKRKEKRREGNWEGKKEED